jgi:protein transport protein SEC24
LLPDLDNPVSKRIQAVISQIRADRPRYLHLQIVRQQMDVLLEKDLLYFLAEDQTMDNRSYVDYLCAVHKAIQEESNQA